MEFEKWRETVDPYTLPFQTFKITEVLGYPHAGNDVFHVTGEHHGEPTRAYLKVSRQPGADIAREAELLKRLPFSFIPEVLEFFPGPPAALVTREKPGERLSFILVEDPAERSLDYMEKYGAALANIHGLAIDAPPVADRKFFHIPERCPEEFERFLKENAPAGASKCFVHGDFHYANILWRDREVSAVLDWELAGIGVREFDMAWALVLRPGQKFLHTWEEIGLFLRGYGPSFSMEAFLYYYILAAVWFLPVGDEMYAETLLVLMREAQKRYQ